MISVNYAISREDYINYHTYLMWDAPERKRTRLRYYLRQVLVNLALVAVIFYSDIFRYSSLSLYIYTGILFAITVMQIFAARANVKKQAEKTAASPGNQSYFLDASLDFTDTGINRKDENSELKYHWKAFIKKEDTADYYFLFISTLQALIIPKRIFKTAEEKQQFEKLLMQKLSLQAEVGDWVKE